MKTNMHMNSLSPVGQPLLSCFRHKRSRFAIALVGGAIFLAHTLFAQSWYTVDDFQYSLGASADATGLAKEPSGTIIYSAGYGYDASRVSHALAFESSDGGTNWATLDDHTEAGNPYGVLYRGIAADSAGNLYAAGYDLTNSGGVQTWSTRRSADGGATWSAVDAISFGTEVARPFAVATDAAGNVYVAGGAQTNAALGIGGPWVWFVRKGTGGTSWATVDAFGWQTNVFFHLAASGVFCHPTAGVFVVGQGPGPTVTSKKGQTSYSFVWTVRRSQDGGATWATVDTYQPGGPLYGSAAVGVGADSAGNIYVVGSASEPLTSRTTAGHWIVRKSTDGGNSWVTVDDFLPPASNYFTPSAGPRTFGADANGNLFVAGTDNQGPSGSSQWIVRESLGGTGIWQTVDTFQYVSGKDSGPSLSGTAAVGDSSGHVFVAGYGYDAAGVAHWLVRKH